MAVTDARHHFHDLGAMRLVLREVQHERHGPDQVFAIKGAENNPLAAIGGSQRVAPECFCRVTEADA